NMQQIGVRRPDNFPLPGLRAPADWQNRWKVSDPGSVTTQLDGAGNLRLTTTTDEPVYLMLNALPQDFRKLDAASGAAVGPVRAHRAQLSAAQSRGMQVQLGLYEYDQL